MEQSYIQKHLRFNFTVNVLDGAFFGVGLGFASYVTVLPLFINTLTDSTILIGLVPALHTVGFLLPQLFTAGRVARLPRYKPMVLWMTLHERWPFLGLAIVALLAPTLGTEITLFFTFAMILTQSFGGGFTATAWQSMISKIMPAGRRGTFFGIQGAAANLVSGFSSILAGIILVSFAYPGNYALSFFLAAVGMVFSFISLGLTREPERPVAAESISRNHSWANVRTILARDFNFRWYLIARLLGHFGWMALGFFTIYAVRAFDMDAQTAGFMTGVMLFANTAANPLLGWVGDTLSHRRVFIMGALLMGLASIIALAAPQLEWFYLVFAIGGLGNAVMWTTAMSFTVEFGTEEERPYYIGMSGTLTGPAALAAPIIGGWLVDAVNFQTMFILAAATAFLTAFVLQFLVREPRPRQRLSPVQMAEAAP